MRRILPLLIIVLSTKAVFAADDWPPRADAAFLADVYPSRDLALRAVSAQLGDDAKIVESNGKITATRVSGEGPRELSVGFVEKPWVATWSTFKNSTQGTVILAQSASPCTSAAEAESAAKKSAIANLLPVVRDRITHTYSGRRVLS